MAAERFPEAPAQIKALRTDDRGYPVPWFVAWIDDKPDFRVIGEGRLKAAVQKDRCWICGGHLGRMKAFVIGPMCAVNRVSSEPPSHLDCATFAARACPFLTQPKRLRNTGGPAGDLTNASYTGGIGIPRNPGVALVWATLRYKVERDGRGGILFDVGTPVRTLWFAHGREATRDEVKASIESGLPILKEMARRDGPEALMSLAMSLRRAWPLLPPEPLSEAA